MGNMIQQLPAYDPDDITRTTIKETNIQSPSSHIKTLSKQFGLKCQTQTEAISIKHDTTASSGLSYGIKFLYSFFRGISTKNVKNYSTNLEALELGANHKINDEIDLHTITTPAILSWKNNHFIIFEGIKNKKIYINNPKTGRSTIDSKTFNKNY